MGEVCYSFEMGGFGKRATDGRVRETERKSESYIKDNTGGQVKSQKDIQLFISQINRRELNILMNKMRVWHYYGKTNSE